MWTITVSCSKTTLELVIGQYYNYGIDNADDYWQKVKGLIITSIDKQCPLKKIRIKDRSGPWITHELIELLHDKDRIRSKAKKTDSQDDWVNFRILKNLTKSKMKEAKTNFTKENVIQYEKDSKKFWEQMNHGIPKRNVLVKYS